MPDTEFEKILNKSERGLGVSMTLILAWVAFSDGEMTDEEKYQVFRMSEGTQSPPEDLKVLLNEASNQNNKSLIAACQYIQKNTAQKQVELLMQLAIGVAISDGKLKPLENYILRFVAEALKLPHRRLSELFEYATGQMMPGPGEEVSLHDYIEAPGQVYAEGREHNLKLIEAITLLGVQPGAPKDEIDQAYHKLIEIHHPDKFEALGEEARHFANTILDRIHEAYNLVIDYS